MKIFQITASYKPAYIYGGPTLSVSRLCEGLVKAGSDVDVLTTTANGKEELQVKVGVPTEIENVPVTYFKRLTKDHTHFSPALLKALKKKLKTHYSPLTTHHSPCILHIHAWWNLVSLLSCRIAKRVGVPVVLSPRGTLSTYSFGNRNRGIKAYIHRFMGKGLLEYCHFHVTSEKEKQDILKLVKPKSITVIPNFVYLPEREAVGNQQSAIGNRKGKVSNEQSVDNNGRLAISSQQSVDSGYVFRLLFLSRIEEKKGLDILFKAVSLLPQASNLKLTLTVAGDGKPEYIKQLKDLANSLDIQINWIGQQDQQEKWKVMQEHDLLVLPSHDENFANVVIECLAMGTPVLVSKNVGLADYVEGQDLGWICITEPQSVATILFSAIEDKNKRDHIRNMAPGMIRKDFNENVLLKRYIKMYNSCACKCFP